MFREIVTHRSRVPNALNAKLVVQADMNSVGAGGACSEYVIEKRDIGLSRIKFQNGPVQEAGVNGWSNEALLAVLQDRMECFQAGPFASGRNEAALRHIQAAMGHLHDRTADRQNRGVEDTLVP